MQERSSNRDINPPGCGCFLGFKINSSEAMFRVMGSITTAIRGVRTVSSIALVCVLSAAGAAFAGDAASIEPGAEEINIAGRWVGRSYEFSRANDCGDEPCTLTLDLGRCATGWCGVEVIGNEQRCGATALRLDTGTPNPNGGSTLFKGKLALAQGTEPYVVEVYLYPKGEVRDQPELEVTGDTGGEFRLFRRSFPFNATLALTGQAQCRPDATVSMLD